MNIKLAAILALSLISLSKPNLNSDQENIWQRIDKKANQLKKDRTEFSNLANINSEFKEFYNQFIADSIFQLEHVSNKLIAAIGLCESTKILTKENWEVISYHYKEPFKDPRYKHVIISDKEVFYLESILKEIGVVSQIGFEKIEGKWQLSLYKVNAC